MRPHNALASLAIILAACVDQPPPTAPLDIEQQHALLGVGGAPLDAALTSALAAARPGELLEVIVDVDNVTRAHALRGTLANLGAGVVAFKHLSVLGVVAPRTAIAAIRLLPGVEGISLNRRLDYTLSEGVATIRADAVHAAGFTGAGVGIAIMDSGIDGLNSDVAYPGKTVQNVKFAASLRDLVTLGVALPGGADELFVENLPNTETSMGHGTHVATIAGGSGSSMTC